MKFRDDADDESVNDLPRAFRDTTLQYDMLLYELVYPCRTGATRLPLRLGGSSLSRAISTGSYRKLLI